MRHVRIHDGRVAEIIPPAEGFSLEKRFHPDIVAAIREADDDVQEGWLFDGNTFSAPEPLTSSAPPARQFTFLEFMDLFTEGEQLTLVEASMTLPAIKLWYDRAVGAQFIDLDDPRTEAGLQRLVDENLISAERKAAVMVGQRPA